MTKKTLLLYSIVQAQKAIINEDLGYSIQILETALRLAKNHHQAQEQEEASILLSSSAPKSLSTVGDHSIHHDNNSAVGSTRCLGKTKNPSIFDDECDCLMREDITTVSTTLAPTYRTSHEQDECLTNEHPMPMTTNKLSYCKDDDRLRGGFSSSGTHRKHSLLKKRQQQQQTRVAESKIPRFIVCCDIEKEITC